MMRYLFIALFFICTPALALTPDKIPAPLQPWIDWVLEDEQNLDCPFVYNQFKQKYCSWPGQLSLRLSNDGGEFNSHWVLYQDSWVFLPGDSRYWPQKVKTNQKPVVVVKKNGRPAVFLTKGQHSLQGVFNWKHLPDNLPVPRQTALIELKVAGKPVVFPVIKQGSLWLRDKDRNQQKKASIAQYMELQVFRKITDAVPLQMTTVLQLDVSGEKREIILPYALLKGFILTGLESPLPAQMEKNGQLKLQIRPGRWQIKVHSRYPEQLTRLALDIQDNKWPPQEIWVFQARRDIRVVEIKNVQAIDSSQTGLPGNWKNLPAYRLQQGDVMIFDVIRRGDAEPEPDQLNLKRTLWLDFEGGGYTIQDQIDGRLSRSWRLNVLPETQLGQVKINGQNQLITRLGDDAVGVEVRQGNLQLTADMRLENSIRTMSVTGWRQDFNSVRAELNIPPGWKLLAVSGVDNNPQSWVSKWTLLDLFLVLISALAVSRLWNKAWGLFALITLALIWHEADAPRLIWLNLLAALALLKVLPEGRFFTLIQWYRNLCWLAFIIILIPYMVFQVRTAIYPPLEKPWQSVGQLNGSAMPEPQILSVESAYMSSSAPVRKMQSGRADKVYAPSSSSYRLIDPNATIQTGPGLPQWQWNKVFLSWNGQVSQNQQISFWYLSPALNAVLKILQVLLVSLLALLMIGVLDKKLNLSWKGLRWVMLLPFLALPVDDSYAGFPDQKMLDELKSRLLMTPDCLPDCVQLANMQLDIDARILIINLELHAQEDSAAPLPAQINQWFPHQVMVDGKISREMIRDAKGRLWLKLSKGVHRVKMEGSSPLQGKFTLPLSLKPHLLSVNSRDWDIQGLYKNGQVAKQLQFNRLTVSNESPEAQFKSSEIPAFIRIERTLKLGLDWTITTRVVRLNKSQAAVILRYPLLKGEAVTTEKIRQQDGMALINMSAEQKTLQWQSSLPKSKQIRLKAAKTRDWTELWRADISPVWHVELQGIAIVHQQDRQGRWLPQWYPWPGEEVLLNITRPVAIEGPSMTIDRVMLSIKPGKRTRQSQINFHLRSSKGGQHGINIPEQAVLQSILINGVSQPVHQQQRTVLIPMSPGEQNIEMRWVNDEPLSVFETTDKVDLGMASVNTNLNIQLGQDRWVLLTLGPNFGPAVLFWGVLIVIIMLSAGLGRVNLTPLKSWQWFLLLLGLSQIPVFAALIVVGWLLALGYRGEKITEQADYFNVVQVLLAIWTLSALVLLFWAVQQGLLGSPDMQIMGNQSSAFDLKWYQDRSESILPTATVVSVPVGVYRILMLLWSLWLALALLNWLKWGWQCVSKQGLWKKPAKKKLIVENTQATDNKSRS